MTRQHSCYRNDNIRQDSVQETDKTQRRQLSVLDKHLLKHKIWTIAYKFSYCTALWHFQHWKGTNTSKPWSLQIENCPAVVMLLNVNKCLLLITNMAQQKQEGCQSLEFNRQTVTCGQIQLSARPRIKAGLKHHAWLYIVTILLKQYGSIWSPWTTDRQRLCCAWEQIWDGTGTGSKHPYWLYSFSFSKSMCCFLSKSFWFSTISSGRLVRPASVISRISRCLMSRAIDTCHSRAAHDVIKHRAIKSQKRQAISRFSIWLLDCMAVKSSNNWFRYHNL